MHILEYVREKKKEQDRFRGIRWQEVIGINNFVKEAGINNPKIALINLEFWC